VVSLVSGAVRNRCYLCGTVERVAECERVEITNVHAVFRHAAENMIGCPQKLGEYPTPLRLFRLNNSFFVGCRSRIFRNRWLHRGIYLVSGSRLKFLMAAARHQGWGK
jgi:hypothetical protein